MRGMSGQNSANQENWVNNKTTSLKNRSLLTKDRKIKRKRKTTPRIKSHNFL